MRFSSMAMTMLLVATCAAQGAPSVSLHIPARDIPAPDTVSPALQAFVARRYPQFAPPYPATNDAWQHLLETAEAQHARIAALLKDQHVSIASRAIAGVACFDVTPGKILPRNRDRLLVNIHGGGYVMDGGEAGLTEAILLAAAAQTRVVAIDYRMAPAFPFPAAIDDVTAVWAALVKAHDPARMAVIGTSTGGALTLNLVQRAQREGLPLPGAIAPGSPWSDMSKTGDSYYVLDLGTHRYEGVLAEMARQYANGTDLKDPRLSPIYGDFSGFPPTLLTSGTRDLFLSNTVRVDRKLREAGVETQLQVIEGIAHAAYLAPSLPESAWVFSEIARFLDRHLKSE